MAKAIKHGGLAEWAKALNINAIGSNDYVDVDIELFVPKEFGLRGLEGLEDFLLNELLKKKTGMGMSEFKIHHAEKFI